MLGPGNQGVCWGTRKLEGAKMHKEEEQWIYEAGHLNFWFRWKRAML